MRLRTRLRIGVIVLSLAGCGILGCKNGWQPFNVDRCASIPSGAIPAPAGRHVGLWQRAQVASASADLGVFYQNEFLPKSSSLSPSGEEHVDRLVQQSLINSVPIVVERSSDSERDEARLQSLQTAFANVGIALPPEQICIAKPAARGLDGFRAQQAVRASLGSGSGGQGGGGQGGAAVGQSGSGGGGQGGGGFGGGGIF